MKQPKRSPPVKTAEINLRVTPALKRAAQETARKDQRTLSSLIERLLTQACERAGVLKGDRTK